MKIKTSELQGAALDWAVAKCEGCSVQRLNNVDMWKHIRQQGAFRFSTDWSQGGPIIEREKIAIDRETMASVWLAKAYEKTICFAGETPLIAAMRCHVASKLGDTVDVPEELTA